MKKRLNNLLLAALILLTAVFIPFSAARAAGVTNTSTPISGGMSHSIALKEDGTLWTWGSNQNLQLGKGRDILAQATPEPVKEVTSFVSIAAGYNFSLALRYDGDVYVLGDGGTAPIYKAPGLTGIIAIVAGQTDGLALDIDGTVWQWTIGENPKKVSKLSSVAAIVAGGAHFFALTHSGEVWAWGANWSGQLGDGTTTDADVPIKVESLANIIYVAAGYSHSLAVAHDGSVYAWGSNTYGQLGDGTTTTQLTPVKVKGISGAVQAAAGNETSMVLTKDQKIYTWGYGEYGQLGDDTVSISKDTPEAIDVVGIPIYIASGVYHCFYVSNEGDLYAWGRNRDHTLGTGKTTNETKPFMVLDAISNIPPEDVIQTNPYETASAWSIPELKKLDELNMLPPMLRADYRNNTTRAEFAAVLVHLYEAIYETEITYASSTKFQDIEKHVFEIEVRKAFAIDIVSGVSDTRFNPEGQITRQEAAKMISTFYANITDDELLGGVRHIPFYKDASKVAEWAVPFVWYAYQNDIMQGSDGYFYPLNNLTREQTLAMVYRMILKYEWI